MSSNAQPGYDSVAPVSAFSYRDVGPAPPEEKKAVTVNPIQEAPFIPGIPPHEVERIVMQTRGEAIAETQKRMQAESDARVAEQQAKVHQALAQFQIEQKDYFSRVESEVVRLALSIAGRIMHREAQVDPMLMSGIVHVALEKLQNGSSVTVHIAPSESVKWREFTADMKKNLDIKIMEDSQMGPQDCVIETNLGSADFSIEAQLKEVEQGFFDLLAVRP